jgi:hypothetical protein
VISDAQGWITHANVRACELLESCERSLVTVLSPGQDQFPQLPHWLADSHEVSDESVGGVRASIGGTPERCQPRVGYFDSWSLLPTLVHVDDLIGCVTTYERDYRAALAVVAVDRDGERIRGEAPRHSAIVRIAATDFLVVLAEPSRPMDAAMTVRTKYTNVIEIAKKASAMSASETTCSARTSGCHE